MKILALLIASVLARTAWAEDVVAYQADGDADAGASDARVAALDEAFGKAVSQALGELVDPEIRRQNKPAIDRELLGRRRLWVAEFKVTKEQVVDDRKQLSVSVRIDRDKLRARLTELNIAVRGDAEAGGQVATLLLRVVAPDGVRATYGLGAEREIAGSVALTGALRAAHFQLKRAPASGPAAKGDGELPFDDDVAEALGAEAKADVVVIASISVGAPVALRGVAANGVLVTATVRLLDRKARRSLGQGGVVSVARGSDPGVVGYAIDRAVVAALTDVLPQQAQAVPQAEAVIDDQPPLAEPGIVLVRLPRTTPWGLVQAEVKHLNGARGVTHATLRRVSSAGWVIGVETGESVERIAAAVKKSPAADTTVQVKIVGQVIEAGLAGAP